MDKTEVTFPTEDGMEIGQPVVHIEFEGGQCVEISARDFDRINVDFGNERAKWRKLNGQSLKKELNIKLWALSFLLAQIEDRQVRMDMDKLRFDMYAMIASMDE